MKTLTTFVFVASAVLSIIVYGLEVSRKIPNLLKTINIDSVFVLTIGLIIILVGSGIILVKGRITAFRKKSIAEIDD